jgi:hypothetical protein
MNWDFVENHFLEAVCYKSVNCFIHEGARLGLYVVPQIKQHTRNTKHACMEIVHCFLDLCEQASSNGNSSDLYSGGSCFQFCTQH